MSRCEPVARGVQISLESEQAAFIRHILILRLKIVDQLDEGQRPHADFGTVPHKRSCHLHISGSDCHLRQRVM